MRDARVWRRARFVAGALLWFSVCACAEAGRGEPAPRALASTLIASVPHVHQKRDFCGEAAAEMYLRALGHDVDQDQVFALSGMDPARGMGATTKELKRALSRLGFEVGKVWLEASAARARSDMEARFAELHADLVDGVPSIVCMHYDERVDAPEHFRLVLGYDATHDEIIFHEPALPSASYQRMPRKRFLALWPLKYDDERWTVIRLRLDEDDIRLPDKEKARGPADYAQHVMALRDTLPPELAIAVEPPFVVIGDGGRAQVDAWAHGTVRSAVAALRTMFDVRDPERIIDVYLFEDARSYEQHAMRISGHAPHTSFGYYDADAGALIMDISTGGGTLVHELVHPFIAASFPDCPAWLNEGLGSLYERSDVREGRLIGFPNWRLPGLQQAIDERRTLSLKALTALDDGEFYGDTTGIHYAQARYLLYYLQEQQLLERFYREFHAARRVDPTGYLTLKRVLGRADGEMPAFERGLDRYTLRLDSR